MEDIKRSKEDCHCKVRLKAKKSLASEFLSGFFSLLFLGRCLTFVPIAEDIEGFLLLTFVGEETFHIVIVLDAVEHTAGGTEIL